MMQSIITNCFRINLDASECCSLVSFRHYMTVILISSCSPNSLHLSQSAGLSLPPLISVEKTLTDQVRYVLTG